MAAVAVPESEQVISEAYIGNIKLAKGTQVLFSFDIKSLDVVEKIRLQQCIDLSLHGRSAWGTLTFSVFKKAFIHQDVSYRRN